MGGARLSVSEDTGLLRVGDASKRVRYVPAKTTTVVKRIKPPTDSDDEQAKNVNIIEPGAQPWLKIWVTTGWFWDGRAESGEIFLTAANVCCGTKIPLPILWLRL